MTERPVPHNLESEKSVLAAAIMDREAAAVAVDTLKVEDFYLQSHQYIFSALKELTENKVGIDLTLISDQLRQNGKLESVGGLSALAEILNSTATSANAEYHAGVVMREAQSRQCAHTFALFSDRFCRGNNPEYLLEEFEQWLAQTRRIGKRTGLLPIGRDIGDEIKEIEALVRGEMPSDGLYLGFDSFHRLTTGQRVGEFWVIAARPSIGKTALALNMADRVSNNKNIVAGFFSLEMSQKQIRQRLLSMGSGLFFEKIRSGTLSEEEIKKIADTASRIKRKANLLLDDTSSLSISGLRARILRAKYAHPKLRVIFIDYLQLLTSGLSKNATRYDQVTYISGQLKHIARDTEVCVVALSQLSRKTEGTTIREPRLSDLRESGSIEQDADGVLLLHRKDRDQPETLCILAKQRQGPMGRFTLHFDLATQTFREEKEIQIEPPKKAKRKSITQAQGTPESGKDIREVSSSTILDESP